MQVRIGINCSGRGDAGGDIVFNIFYGYGHIDLRLPSVLLQCPGSLVGIEIKGENQHGGDCAQGEQRNKPGIDADKMFFHTQILFRNV